MELPAEREKVQLIAVLRVLDWTQDAVASGLHIGKIMVVRTEEWLRKGDLAVVCDTLNDQAVKQTVGRELHLLEEMDNSVLVRAVQVTRDGILLHYGRKVPENADAKLRLGSPSVNVFTDRSRVARYAFVEVASTTEVEAKGCWALAQVLPAGPTFPLHWAGMPYTTEESTSARIIIRQERAARLDVALALPPPGRAIDVPPNALLSGRISVIVSGPNELCPWHGEGCWLAQPLALDSPDPRLEAYLKPGKHKIKISVGCENGEGDSREFMLNSPTSWERLTFTNA